MHRHHLIAAALVVAGIAAVSPARGQGLLPDVKPEFVANTFTLGDQAHPAVAAAPDGTLWIAWFEGGQSPTGIKARHFSAAGSPLGPEVWVHSGSGLYEGPRISSTADGGCVVAWMVATNVWARRLDRQGALVGSEVRGDPSPVVSFIHSPDIAIAADGSFVLAWVRSTETSETVFAARFDPQGLPLGSPRIVSAEPPRPPSDTPGMHLAGAADGSFLIVWKGSQVPNIFAVRYDGPSGEWSAAVQVDGPPWVYGSRPAAALASDGSAIVVWSTGDSVVARRLTAAGVPTGPEVLVGQDHYPYDPPAVAADADGNFLVVFVVSIVPNLPLQGRLLQSDLTPVGPVFPLSDPEFLADHPAVATTAAGGFALAWTSGFESDSPFHIPPPVSGRDGSQQGIAARILASARCFPGSAVLCLGADRRFAAKVDWKNPFNGDTGTGRGLPLTPDTGAFWFFGDQNLELMVKVLDGSEVNGNFWVYAGGLSNVEYTLTVTDTATGGERSYHNPPFQFGSLADILAFPTAVLSSERSERTTGTASLRTAAGCTDDSADLCLGSGQFQVNVDFTDPRSGLAGHGTAVPLTADTGAFWFFGAANLELMVKVLDGRAVNGKFWVFYGALSDVDFRVTVTRPETGEVRTYHNPRGTLASRGDTEAF